MKYIDFQQHMRHYGIFSLQDIRKLDHRFDSRRLVEWQQNGQIQKVINKWYVFSDHSNDEAFKLLVSNRIYSPSYISLEFVLAMHSIIPEGVFSFTAVSSRKTQQYHTCLGAFTYRHLKAQLNFGFQLIKTQWGAYRIAEAEKAIVDYLYLHPNVSAEEDFAALRWNALVVKELDLHKIRDYAQMFNQARLNKRVDVLFNYLNQ